MKKKYDFNLNMIILIIVIVVIFIVGGVYMFNLSSKADKNQEATSGDNDTQTYHTKSNPIKFDANKETKQATHNNRSPAHAILRNLLKKKSSSKANENQEETSRYIYTQPPHPPAHQPPPPPAPQPPHINMSPAPVILKNYLNNNSSKNSVKALIPFYRSSSTKLEVNT